jgi:hypothetical protein
MPIFEKNSQRVYFAHIPKTAGVTIYYAFVGSGWNILNLQERHEKHSASNILKEQFGIASIQKHGKTYCYPHSIQHSPKIIWQRWGPFTDIFTIARNPVDRFISAARYHYSSNRELQNKLSFNDFFDWCVQSVSQNIRFKYLSFDGHFIPQHHFINRKTCIFLFEQDWLKPLSERFSLDISMLKQFNKSDLSLAAKPNKSQIRILKHCYKKDFALLSQS